MYPMPHNSATPLSFLAISAVLTGFSETELLSTGMLDDYFTTILSNNGSDEVSYFFANAAAILHEPGSTEESIVQAIGTQLIPDSCYGALTKNIVILWYTGNWVSGVVSARSYLEGLMWTAGHTHPPGGKQPGYGSWSHLPLQ
jgi:hypothetical protein